jgi:hypothetical protein
MVPETVWLFAGDVRKTEGAGKGEGAFVVADAALDWLEALPAASKADTVYV